MAERDSPLSASRQRLTLTPGSTFSTGECMLHLNVVWKQRNCLLGTLLRGQVIPGVENGRQTGTSHSEIEYLI